MSDRFIRIGNCSGFYGDKLSAAKDMVEGGKIDVLTGDYLAELTMAILFNQKLKVNFWSELGVPKVLVNLLLSSLSNLAECAI